MSRWADLRIRALSAAILGAAVLFITWWDPISFDALLLLAGVILLKEWRDLTKNRSYAFLWMIVGIIYICTALIFLAITRMMNVKIAFLLFGTVWAADIGGYLVGKKWGIHKIAPSISPGKSWEGFAGSFMASTSFLLICEYIDHARGHAIGRFDWQFCVTAAVACCVLGLMGDLFESWLKRKAGVKDSGTLIPGHGGLFDRVDALMPCAIVLGIPFVFIVLMCSQPGAGQCL